VEIYTPGVRTVFFSLLSEKMVFDSADPSDENKRILQEINTLLSSGPPAVTSSAAKAKKEAIEALFARTVDPNDELFKCLFPVFKPLLKLVSEEEEEKKGGAKSIADLQRSTNPAARSRVKYAKARAKIAILATEVFLPELVKQFGISESAMKELIKRAIARKPSSSGSGSGSSGSGGKKRKRESDEDGPADEEKDGAESNADGDEEDEDAEEAAAAVKVSKDNIKKQQQQQQQKQQQQQQQNHRHHHEATKKKSVKSKLPISKVSPTSTTVIKQRL
jgi:hypothetical protein